MIGKIKYTKLTKTNFKYNNSNKTSIVLFGSNLGPLYNTGKFSKNISKLIYLHPYYYSIVVGMLLSDGWLEKSSINSNTRFRFKQSINRADYVLQIFFVFSHYCFGIPYLTKSLRKGKLHYGLQFNTRSLPCFNELYNLFYKNQIKKVPKNIYDLLSPVALAHWIMGDGAILNKGMVLCTDSFTLQEVVKLMNVLLIKYKINCTVQGIKQQRPRIYVLPESLPKLR